MKGDDYIKVQTKVLLFSAIVLIILAIVLNSIQSRKEEVMVIENSKIVAGVVEVPLQALNLTIKAPVTVEDTNISTVAMEEPKWVEMDVPSNNSFKSYMDCSKITDVNSEQYKFKYDYLCSASGIMLVDNRYVIAIGSYYTTKIGCRVDLVMENGEIVECIVGDCKADKHTDSLNRQNPNGSIVEMIVATDNLSDEVRLRGDCSYADPRLMGEIIAIRVYLEN